MRARHLLQEYLEGWLPEVPSGEMEAHLASCATCAREMEQYAALDRALWRQPRLVVPQGFKDAVLSRLPAAPTAAARRPFAREHWIPVLLATAAAVLLLLTGVLREVAPESGKALVEQGSSLVSWTGSTAKGAVNEAFDRTLGADPLALTGASTMGMASSIFTWTGAIALAVTLGLLRPYWMGKEHPCARS